MAATSPGLTPRSAHFSSPVNCEPEPDDFSALKLNEVIHGFQDKFSIPASSDSKPWKYTNWNQVDQLTQVAIICKHIFHANVLAEASNQPFHLDLQMRWMLHVNDTAHAVALGQVFASLQLSRPSPSAVSFAFQNVQAQLFSSPSAPLSTTPTANNQHAGPEPFQKISLIVNDHGPAQCFLRLKAAYGLTANDNCALPVSQADRSPSLSHICEPRILPNAPAGNIALRQQVVRPVLCFPPIEEQAPLWMPVRSQVLHTSNALVSKLDSASALKYAFLELDFLTVHGDNLQVVLKRHWLALLFFDKAITWSDQTPMS